MNQSNKKHSYSISQVIFRIPTYFYLYLLFTLFLVLLSHNQTLPFGTDIEPDLL